MATEERFTREAGKPHLAAAPAAAPSTGWTPEPRELLERLERQAEECGRLAARADGLEKAAAAERAARRRLADTLQRERTAAEALHERARRAEAAEAAAGEELERLTEAAKVSELHLQDAWGRLSAAEQRLAWAERPAWRKLLRRPPGEGQR